MDVAWPKLLLLTDAFCTARAVNAWRFVLSNAAGGEILSAGDEEPGVDADRVALLALVRGLEAISQPARVSLATSSRYVRRGLASGLRIWRGNDWKWERFGRLVSVRDHDLWRRVDLALRYHRLECRSASVSCARLPGEGAEKDVGVWTSRASAYTTRRATRGTSQFPEEPVLMVVRSGRRSLRIHQSACAGLPRATAC